MAVGNDQDPIPVTIDLAETGGILSGQIISTYGTFAITGGTRSGDSITLQFDVNGGAGVVTGKLTDGRLLGTYAAGDQTGSVDVRKTGASGAAASAPPTPPTPILILGVYHMENPISDQNKTPADDVLTPKRQQEIEQLIDDLARFRPTKIAIEAQYADTFWPDTYRKYLTGQYKLGRNEIEQVAFRIAKRMNLPTLYGVDSPMFGAGTTPREMTVPNPKNLAEAPKVLSDFPPDEQLLRQSTVIQYLAHINSAAEIRKSQESYMASLLPTEGPDTYKKVDQVANWYKLNLRIFANINRIVEPGKDRVLVIIGAGHLKLLRDFAADAPYFDLFDAESLLN